MAYFGHSWSNVGDLCCQLLIFYVWFIINQLNVFFTIVSYFQETANDFASENLGNLAKSLHSW